MRWVAGLAKTRKAASGNSTIVGEWVGSTEGIGALNFHATCNFDAPLLYALITAGGGFPSSSPLSSRFSDGD